LKGLGLAPAVCIASPDILVANGGALEAAKSTSNERQTVAGVNVIGPLS
jgi:hypothetical protein